MGFKPIATLSVIIDVFFIYLLFENAHHLHIILQICEGRKYNIYCVNNYITNIYKLWHG